MKNLLDVLICGNVAYIYRTFHHLNVNRIINVNISVLLILIRFSAYLLLLLQSDLIIQLSITLINMIDL